MIEGLFLNVVEITLATSWVILPLVLFSSLLKKKYTAKWSYLVWLIIAARLILPINFTLPQAAFTMTVPNNFSPLISEAYTHTKDNLSKNIPINNFLSKETTESTEKFDPDNPYNITSCFAKDNKNTDKTTFDFQQLFSLKNISLLWLLGVFLFLIYHSLGYLFFRKSVLRWSWPITDEKLLDEVQRIGVELDFKKPIPICSCRLVSSPMVLGLFNPILLLPETFSYIDNLSIVLKHELIHLKRKDILYKIVLNLANAIHWFNPLIYFMTLEANKDLEFYCDEAVIENMDINYRHEYSNAILSVMGSKTNKRTILSTNFNGNIATMKKRFKNILNLKRKRKGTISLPLILTVVLTSSTLIACDNISTAIPSELEALALGYLKEHYEIKIDYTNTHENIPMSKDTKFLDYKIKYTEGEPLEAPYGGYTLELADIEITNPKMLNAEDMIFDFKADAILVYGNGLLRRKAIKGTFDIDVDGNGRSIGIKHELSDMINPYCGNFQNPPAYLLPDYNKDKQILTIIDEYTSSKELCAAYMKAIIGKEFPFIGLNTAYILTTVNIEDGQNLMDTLGINRIKIKDSKERLAKDSNSNSKAYYELELDVENPGTSSLKKGKNKIWLYMCAKNNEGTDQWIVQQVSKDGPPSKEWWSTPVYFQ